MKKVLGCLSLCIAISGCSNLTNPTSDATNISQLATAGSLSCKANELCPNVVVEWDKQQKDRLQIDVALSSTYEYYDITGMTFSVDNKLFSYEPVGKTQQKYINRLIPKRSSNTFVIQSLFLNELRNAKNVDLMIQTNKGTIKRPVYTPTQQSTLYQNFVRLIETLPRN